MLLSCRLLSFSLHMYLSVTLHILIGYHYCVFRQQLERLPNRRQVETNKNNAAGSSNNASGENQSTSSSAAKNNSPFLLARFVCCDKKNTLYETNNFMPIIGNFCDL